MITDQEAYIGKDSPHTVYRTHRVLIRGNRLSRRTFYPMITNTLLEQIVYDGYMWTTIGFIPSVFARRSQY